MLEPHTVRGKNINNNLFRRCIQIFRTGSQAIVDMYIGASNNSSSSTGHVTEFLKDLHWRVRYNIYL